MLEALKIELRSILISEKNGVELANVSRDYEMLLGKRLPYKELGFKDVASLMQALPDVARESRSANGTVTYYAVCDKNTAHIQRLVSSQKSKSKKVSRGRGRGRGRFGTFRGRIPYGQMKRSQGEVRFTGGRKRGSGKPGDALFSSEAKEWPGSGDFNSHSRMAAGTFTPISANMWLDDENGWDKEKSRLRQSNEGDIENSQLSDLDSSEGASGDFMNLKIAINDRGKRCISKRGSPLGKEKGNSHLRDLRDLIIEKRSGRSLAFEHGLGHTLMRDEKGNSHLRDLRDLIFEKHSGRSLAFEHGLGHTLMRANQALDIANQILQVNKRTWQQTAKKPPFPKYLPPRLQKMNESVQNRKAFLPSPPSSSPAPQEADTSICREEKDACSSRHWVPPESGEQYLQAFRDYFETKGKPVPKIEVIAGQVNKKHGFYGRLSYHDVYYHPLEIQSTEEQARQNLARTFCLKNNIALPSKYPSPATPKLHAAVVNFDSSFPRYSPLWFTPQLDALLKPYNPPAVSESPPPSPMLGSPEPLAQPQQQNPLPAPLAHPQLQIPPASFLVQPQVPPVMPQNLPAVSAMTREEQDQKEKIYRLMKSNGIWLQQLPKLYEEKYGEALRVDILKMADQWTDYFSLEEVSPQRYIIYPVQNALSKGDATVHSTNANKMDTLGVPVPPCHLPLVRSHLDMVFSFAYSGDDAYFQRQDTVNLVSEIEEVLSQECEKMSPPEASQLETHTLVVAKYQEEWFRAEIKALDQTSVTVYFIDYGNTEEVTVHDLRPVPVNDLVRTTSQLAVRCAFRKPKPGRWHRNVGIILSKITEKTQIFTCLILEHNGDQCLIDLYIPEGPLVNPMLIQDLEPPVKSPPALQQQQQVFSPVLPQQQQQKKKAPHTPLTATSSGVKLFTDDPESLTIPEESEFGVYICRVMSERSVLLKIVDDNYSNKLDDLERVIQENFYSWSVPKKIKQSNIYACMVLATSEDVADEEDGEEGRTGCSDQNHYYRVRILKELQDKTFDCYLPDHGDHEHVSRSQLREIDPQLNVSLPYQTFMATLHGLDRIAENWRPMAVKILIKLLMSNCEPLVAVKAGHSAEKQCKNKSSGVNPVVLSRVRKILSCLAEIDPSKVASVYGDIYNESIENVEEVIKHIPGYGFWKEGLEITLMNTSCEDKDININETVLLLINTMQGGEAEGKNPNHIFDDYFQSSTTSQADTESGSFQEGAEASVLALTDAAQAVKKERLQDALSQLSISDATGNEARQSWVQDYVNDLPKTNANGRKGEAVPVVPACECTPSSPASHSESSSHSTPPHLPKYWNYPKLQLVSLYVISAESPSSFVAIPVEQRGALEKLEAAITQFLGTAEAQPALTPVENVLYAAEHDGSYRRALFVSWVNSPFMKVFFADYNCFDVVQGTEVYELPEQFYSLPFLASKMCLGGVLPLSENWDQNAVKWFITNVCRKSLYGIISKEEEEAPSASIQPSTENAALVTPNALIVQLIDTSENEDLVVHEYLVDNGMAVRDEM